MASGLRVRADRHDLAPALQHVGRARALHGDRLRLEPLSVPRPRKRKIKLGVDVSYKKGGAQIEYTDQDPRIHRMYLDALAKNGVACRMGEFVDETMLLAEKG